MTEAGSTRARFPHFRAWLTAAGWHARLDAFVVGCACLIDALVTTHLGGLGAADRAVVALGALAAGATAGALLGVLQSVLLRLLPLTEAWLGVGARLGAALSSGVGDRAKVVRFHAAAFGILAFGALGATAYAWLLEASVRIKEESLRSWLLVLSLAFIVLGTPLLTAAVAPVLERVFGALDRRLGLPRPAHPVTRFALFGLLPVLAIAVPLFVEFGVKLGVLAHLLAAVLFVALVRFSALVWGHTAPRFASPSWGRASYFLLGASVLTGATLLSHSDVAAYWSNRGAATPFVTRALQTLTDVDRDGVSSLFGGGDCAPFDAARSPATREIRGNGIDENCDGADAAEAHALADQRHYYGKLPDGAVRRYNVLWYVVDSLRADHLPLYGYTKNTSPTLTRLGKQSWVFTKAYSQSSNTTLSMPSMLSGRWPGSLTWKRSYYPVAEPGEHLLPDLLGKAGYYTGLVVNDWVRRKLPGIQHGFAHTWSAPASHDWKSGEILFSKTVTAMAEATAAGTPFFLVVHIDDVHHPYVSHRGHALPEFPSDDPALSNYDKGIALFDRTLSTMLAHLDSTGLAEDTILIVTADHGEEFLEHGGTIHSRTCYVESVHVPLIVRVPGEAARRIDAHVALADVVPTLVELLGLVERATEPDGQSLLIPVEEPHSVDPERPTFCNIFQMLGGRQNFFTGAVRSGDLLLVHELLSDTRELYDTRRDRAERHDLSSDPARAADVARLQQLIQASLTGNLFEARTFQ